MGCLSEHEYAAAAADEGHAPGAHTHRSWAFLACCLAFQHMNSRSLHLQPAHAQQTLLQSSTLSKTLTCRVAGVCGGTAAAAAPPSSRVCCCDCAGAAASSSELCAPFKTGGPASAPCGARFSRKRERTAKESSNLAQIRQREHLTCED